MFAYTRLAEGLLVAHLFLALAYLIGSNATAWAAKGYRAKSSSDAMIRLVCTCALGFASIGFGAFIIALVGWLNPWCIAGMLLVLFAAGCSLTKSSPFRRTYWSERRLLIYDAFDLPHVLVYYAMLVAAFPDVNVTLAGADPIDYHWAYAMDWVNAGRLIVDPFLREPFYAHNDLMLVTLVFAFGGAVFAQFAIWMAGLLTALGVCAGVRQGFSSDGLWPSVIGVILAVSAVLSPTYIRWLDSGFLDAMLGFFALASILALRRAWIDDDGGWKWLVLCAAIAAFLIGSKTSLLPFVVVFAGVLWFAARRLKCGRPKLAIALAVLVVLASPWYVRNLILAGDPIPPVLNIALHGHDGLNTKFDEQQIAGDLAVDRSPLALLSVPVRAFLTPDTHAFREFGQNALMLLLYIPTLCIIVAALTLKRRLPPTVTLPVFLLTMMVGYWLFTASFMRYSMLFYPSLALCLALLAGNMKFPIRKSGPVLALVALLTLIVTPNAEAHAFYYNFFVNGVQNMPTYYTQDESFLDKYVNGYPEEQFTVEVMKRLRLTGRLYVLGPTDEYYFRRDGVVSIGDYTGPASYFDLARSTDARQAVPFLTALGVDAVEIDRVGGIPGFATPLERELLAGGYCSVSIPIPSTTIQLYVRSKLNCAVTRQMISR